MPDGRLLRTLKRTGVIKKWIHAFLSLSLGIAFSSCAEKKREKPRASRALRPTGEEAQALAWVRKNLKGRIAFQSDRDGDNEIYVMDIGGKNVKKLTDNAFDDGYPKVSPDGKRILFESNREGDYQIYAMDLDGENVRRVTRRGKDNRYPCWSPDGRETAYDSTRGGRPVIYRTVLETGEERQISRDRYKNELPDWSPDGRLLAYTTNRINWLIYTMNLEGEDRKDLTPRRNCRPEWSPDGKKIAFTSNMVWKKGEIFLMNSDGSGKENLTNSKEMYDYEPSWSPDGKWLVFASSPDKRRGNWELYLMSVGKRKPVRITFHSACDNYPDWF